MYSKYICLGFLFVGCILTVNGEIVNATDATDFARDNPRFFIPPNVKVIEITSEIQDDQSEDTIQLPPVKIKGPKTVPNLDQL